MTMYAFARLAWAATIGGVAGAWAYLSVVPATGAYWVDNLVAVVVVLVAFTAAGFAELRLELLFTSGRRSAGVAAAPSALARERVGARAS